MTVQEYILEVKNVNLRDRLLHLASNYHNMQKEVKSFSDALGYAFDWGSSLEGENYWRDMYLEEQERERADLF